MRVIVVAIPTIKARGDAWEDVAQAWQDMTPEPVLCVPSWRVGSWSAGLNEVWENHPGADIMVMGSDDMIPRAGWLEAIEPYLDRGVLAPQVIDPRFTRFGPEVSDGQEVDMSSFPILSQRFLRQVFPLPPELHYYSDNLISDKARKHGTPTVAVPSCVIDHLMDERARGAGLADEMTRMAYDKAIYKKILSGSG